MLTRKDYRALSSIINHVAGKYPASAGHDLHLGTLVQALSRWLANDNPRFDCAQFAQACHKGME